MNSLTRENHFVPQALLRRWSNDGAFLNAHDLLVSDERVPQWRRQSIRGAACQTDLYTEYDGTQDGDTYEREVGRDYETPGLEVIDDLINNRRVSANGWRSLIDLFALQALRTPKAFITFAERVERQLDDALSNTIKEAEEQIATWGRLTPASGERSTRTQRSRYFTDTMRVRFDRLETGQPVARAIVKSPRSFWTARNRHIMDEGAAEVLRRHRWSIAEAHGDMEWPITDHPVVTLHFNSTTDYMLGGGWGKENTDLFMPISPKKLLFVEVGKKMHNRFSFDAAQTEFLRKVMVENAHRVVYCRNREESLLALRPRLVDASLLKQERANWARWNSFHRAQEATFHDAGVSGSSASRVVGR